MKAKGLVSRRVARFRIDGASHLTAGGTVTIDRALGLVTVRQYKRHRTYTLPLWKVAEFVMYHVVKAELQERKANIRRGTRSVRAWAKRRGV